MYRLTTLLAVFATLTGLGSSTLHAEPPQAEKFSTDVHQTIAGQYLLYLPPEYENGDKPWPLIIYLHGAGAKGDNPELVEAEGIPKLLAEGMELPFIVVAPQCPAGERWSHLSWSTSFTNELLRHLTESYRVDEERIYLTGLSMGGFGTWSLAFELQDRFAAIAPISGGASKHKACRLKSTPTWVFHGVLDERVPLERSLEIVEILRQCGGSAEVRVTTYPDQGHESLDRPYRDRELYDWFLKYRRSQAER